MDIAEDYKYLEVYINNTLDLAKNTEALYGTELCLLSKEAEVLQHLSDNAEDVL